MHWHKIIRINGITNKVLLVIPAVEQICNNKIEAIWYFVQGKKKSKI